MNAPPNPRNLGPSGVDLMRRLNESGLAKTAPSVYVTEVRKKVVENCDELLDVGARIRPLKVNGNQIGWVRGVHGSERRRLNRWMAESNEFIIQILLLATTLSRSEIIDLSSSELRNLMEVVKTMTDYDISLFPYMSAFVTTLTSENLWHGRGTDLTSFENRVVHLPDGAQVKLLVPSDHSRLWGTLCTYREQAKVRLDASWNAVLQARPLAGKSVDPLINELKSLSQQLVTNSNEPWEMIVRVAPTRNMNDGWAHAENMDTREGMMQELYGMINNDRHEQLMDKFGREQIEAAEARKKAIEDLSKKRGGPGINNETIQVHTESESRRREFDLKRGKVSPIGGVHNNTEVTVDPIDRMKRYQ